MNHQPGTEIQAAVTQHLVEGEIVERLDQIRIRDSQGRDVAGKECVVVPAARFRWGALKFSLPFDRSIFWGRLLGDPG